MEWHGVSINSWRATVWATRAMKQGVVLIFTALCSLILAGYIGWLAMDLNLQNHWQIQQKQSFIQQIEQINTQLNRLEKTQENIPLHDTLTEKQIERFIHYLKSLPIQGGLEFVQLNFNQRLQLKLIGKLSDSADFERITAQLTQLAWHYQLDHFQTDEKQQIEFQLTIFPHEDEK